MRRSAPLLLAAALVAASCGSSDGSADRDDDTVAVSTTSEQVDSTPGPDDTDPGDTQPDTGDTQPDTGPDDTSLPGPTVVDLPEQPDDVPFPDTEWPTGPLPEGVESADLDALTDTAFAEPGDPQHVRSLVVIHEGRLVYEAYHPSYGPDTVNPSFSVAKSVTSAAVGILAGEGLVDVDGPAPVAGWDDDRRDITVEQLLHMASGLEWAEVYEPGSAPFEMFAAADASDSAAGRPLVDEPGTRFNYSTGTTAILAQIITDAAWAAERGVPVDPATEPDPAAGVRLLEARLFDPLGITSAELQLDPEGTWLGGLGANMTSRDFARFGLLYMRDGVWDGERILPEGWVQYSFTPSPASAGYGAQWWLEPETGRYEARGLFGQVVALVPAEDLVVVVNSEAGGGSDDLVNGVIGAFTSA